MLVTLCIHRRSLLFLRRSGLSTGATDTAELVGLVTRSWTASGRYNDPTRTVDRAQHSLSPHGIAAVADAHVHEGQQRHSETESSASCHKSLHSHNQSCISNLFGIIFFYYYNIMTAIKIGRGTYN